MIDEEGHQARVPIVIVSMVAPYLSGPFDPARPCFAARRETS